MEESNHVIAQRACDLILACRIDDFPIDVLRIAEHNRFSVLRYGQCQDTLKRLGLLAYSQKHSAFSFKHSSAYYIFVSDHLCPDEEMRLIAHEIGHIVLDHIEPFCIPDITPEQEADAEEFARHLMAPLPILSKEKVTTPEEIKVLTKLSLSDSQIVCRELKVFNNNRSYYWTTSQQKPSFREPTLFRSCFLALMVLTVLLATGLLMGRNTPEPLLSTSSLPESNDKSNDIIISETISTETPTTTEPETTVPTTTTTGTPTTTTTATTVPSTTTVPPTTTTTTLPQTTAKSTTTVTTTKVTATTTKTARKTTNPVSSMVFWTDAGDRYHLYLECQTLQHSVAIRCGTIEEANKAALCYYCESRYLRESN